MPTPARDDAPVIAFADGDAFDTWLTDHSEQQVGVWLKIAKRASGIPSLTADEAVDIGLCHGWISGQRRALDERYFLQKYVPRRPGSRWSQINVAKVAELLAAGRMRPRGLAEVAAARADGRWDAAYPSQSTATVPADLATALDAAPAARRAFDALDRTRRYELILRVVNTRTTAGRAGRIAAEVASLSASAD